MNNTLFLSPNGNITRKNFVVSLKNSGLKSGDTVMLHSDLGVFGKFAPKVSPQFIADAVIDSFLEVLGSKGTLIIPTFTYSFCNGVDYNPKTSKSTIGALPNLVLKRKDGLRTLHPLFSTFVIGHSKNRYQQASTETSFGKNSLFDFILQDNALIASLGVKLVSTATLFHHIEQLGRVPYRYYKTFSGQIVTGAKKRNANCEYFVRRLNINTAFNLEKMDKFCLETGTIKRTQIGRGFIDVTNARTLTLAFLTEMIQDPFFITSE